MLAVATAISRGVNRLTRYPYEKETDPTNYVIMQFRIQPLVWEGERLEDLLLLCVLGTRDD
jgi:hypothetical protein